MDNDIAPPNYSSPLIPVASDFQQIIDKKGQQETLEQLPLLKKVIARLDQRIAAADSIRESRRIAKSHNISSENAEVVLLELSKMLEVERSYIQGRIDRLR